MNLSLDKAVRAISTISAVSLPDNHPSIHDLRDAIRDMGYTGSLDPDAEALVVELRKWRAAGGAAPAYVWKALERYEVKR